MSTVFSAIVPVFLVAGAGYLVRRAEPLHIKTLSALNVYLLIPCLVFSSLSRQAIEWGLFGKFALATVVVYCASIGILHVVARFRGIEGSHKSALLMTSFVNLGNFGLPVSKFAFGDEGLALAVIVMVCGSMLQNTVGLYFAQRGNHSARRAFASVFLFPIVYAFSLALIFQRMGWHLPAPLANAVEMTGDAAIPIQLLLLGIKLAESRIDTGVDVFLATGVRLAVGPALAVATAFALGLKGLDAAIFILQMSGPVAVGMASFGVQFDVHPRFLASVVSWSFLLSLVSVSFILYVLMH